MTFLKTYAWPVVAGLLASFVIMMTLEYINSLFYPLPENLDWNDAAVVQAFTASLPWTAYVLVLLGWIAGAFAAGALTTYLSAEEKYRLSLVVGIILTLGGIANNIMIGHDMFFNIVGLPMFLIFTYLGHRFAMRRGPAAYDTVSA
ncbi:MAG TPA: hypothetical protein VNM40_01120 [Candidatus Paceibacterota bacterium]|nr:hypothetical protein [Candidatus Paceibacterota bacterium]